MSDNTITRRIIIALFPKNAWVIDIMIIVKDDGSGYKLNDKLGILWYITGTAS